MQFTFQIKGLKELERKLDGKFLIQPEMEHVRDALVTRIGRRRKTRGFRNNPLAVTVSPLLSGSSTIAQVGTPLNAPRTTGSAWKKFVASLVNGSFMRRQLNSAAKKIAARWAS